MLKPLPKDIKIKDIPQPKYYFTNKQWEDICKMSNLDKNKLMFQGWEVVLTN